MTVAPPTMWLMALLPALAMAETHQSTVTVDALGGYTTRPKISLVRRVGKNVQYGADALDHSAKAAEEVSIVMADQRNVLEKDPASVQMQDLSFIDVSVLMNYRYAKQHGYHFAFYEMPHEKTCRHSVYGERHPSWCKLATLVHAQNQHPNIKYRAYVDSDMYVNHQEISIDQMLAAAVPQSASSKAGAKHCSLCEGASCQDLVQQADGWLQTNGEGLLGAFVLIRGGQKGNEILKKVWNLGSGKMASANKGFPWEQMAWLEVYEKSLKTDHKLVGIAGLDANWTGHGTPTKCNNFDGGIHLDVWSTHTCHFEDDVFQMIHHGSKAARTRMRNSLGCGADARSSNLSMPWLFTNETKRKLEHHDLYAGNRKILYLATLKETMNETEFRELYKGAYHSKVTLSSSDMEKLGAEIETPVQMEQSLADEALDEHSSYENAARKYYETRPNTAEDLIPLGSRQREFWCDNP